VSIYVLLDISPIIELSQTFKPKVDAALKQAMSDLTKQSYAHLVELVQANLHSTRQLYIDALSPPFQDGDVWIIQLDKKALFIENGLPAGFSLLKGLLNSPKAKTSAEGNKYIAVPFQHNKGPTQNTPAQQSLTDTIKAEFKKRKIPYGKLEKDDLGNPKIGLLHTFSIMDKPVKTHEGVGQGHGPIGAAKQGPTGIPFLQNIAVYQKHVVNPKTGQKSTQKAVMTFRMASSKNPDAFKHPGLEAKLFFEKTAQWALQEWTERIQHQVIASISE
jgi:hypothetical protein